MKKLKLSSLIKNYIAPAVFICLLGMLAGCVDFTLKSVWKDHDIVFDGKNTEWQKAMVKDKNVAFGAFNDDEYLYLCLSITDKVTKAQLMGLFKQDFYIWFDTKTGIQEKRQRNLGLKFTNDSVFMEEDLLSKTRYLKVHAFQVIADEMMSHLTIRVMRNFNPAAALSEAKGIDSGIWIFKDGRQLVYELKVPLEKSAEHPYAVGAIAGKPIYVGLETAPINVAMLEKQLGLDQSYEMENTANREGTGPGGIRRGMTAAQRKDFETEIALENFRPVNIWCKVLLAKKS